MLPTPNDRRLPEVRAPPQKPPPPYTAPSRPGVIGSNRPPRLQNTTGPPPGYCNPPPSYISQDWADRMESQTPSPPPLIR